jgi:hypothetical protein
LSFKESISGCATSLSAGGVTTSLVSVLEPVSEERRCARAHGHAYVKAELTDMC